MAWHMCCVGIQNFVVFQFVFELIHLSQQDVIILFNCMVVLHSIFRVLELNIVPELDVEVKGFF